MNKKPEWNLREAIEVAMKDMIAKALEPYTFKSSESICDRLCADIEGYYEGGARYVSLAAHEAELSKLKERLEAHREWWKRLESLLEIELRMIQRKLGMLSPPTMTK